MKLKEVNAAPGHYGENIRLIDEFKSSGMNLAHVELEDGDNFKSKYQRLKKIIKTKDMTDVVCFVRNKKIYLKRV